jgi:hypothetical protein
MPAGRVGKTLGTLGAQSSDTTRPPPRLSGWPIAEQSGDVGEYEMCVCNGTRPANPLAYALTGSQAEPGSPGPCASRQPDRRWTRTEPGIRHKSALISGEPPSYCVDGLPHKHILCAFWRWPFDRCSVCRGAGHMGVRGLGRRRLQP